MGKISITSSGATRPAPFLRGILTRSLENAGLSFEDAYRLASKIRNQLTNGGADREIPSDRLKRIVHEALLEEFGKETAERYMAWSAPRTTIYVRSGGSRKPFYRGEFLHGLNPCCLTPEEAADITSEVYELLLDRGESEITTDELVVVAARRIRARVGRKAARTYVNWIKFKDSRRPLIILIGGVSGSGKSTIAAELANRLDIAWIQSTDMLREVMRLMIPESLAPVLHASSFVTWKKMAHLDESLLPKVPTDSQLIQGYESQAKMVSVACDGVIKRTLTERVSLILEGVNVQPEWAARLARHDDAIIVPIMLGVLKGDELLERLRGRKEQAPERHTQEYLDHFDIIYRLQSYLLSEADQQHVTVINNEDRETTVKEIMRTVDQYIQRGLGKAVKK